MGPRLLGEFLLEAMDDCLPKNIYDHISMCEAQVPQFSLCCQVLGGGSHLPFCTRLTQHWGLLVQPGGQAFPSRHLSSWLVQPGYTSDLMIWLPYLSHPQIL